MTGDASGGQIPAPASVHPPAEAFEAAYRAKRAQVLADRFHEHGIDYEAAGKLEPGDMTDAQWEALLGKDPDTGVQFRKPSQKTIDQARVFLAGKSAAARNPQALAAAQELAKPEPASTSPRSLSSALKDAGFTDEVSDRILSMAVKRGGLQPGEVPDVMRMAQAIQKIDNVAPAGRHVAEAIQYRNLKMLKGLAEGNEYRWGDPESGQMIPDRRHANGELIEAGGTNNAISKRARAVLGEIDPKAAAAIAETPAPVLSEVPKPKPRARAKSVKLGDLMKEKE